MKFFILLLACCGVALANPTKLFGVNHPRIPVGPVSPHDPKIVGGTDAKPGVHNHQISLQVKPVFGARYHTCGGTLLNATHVVCAAHCVVSQTLSRLTVVVGAYNVKDENEATQQRVAVKALIPLKAYVSSTIKYDASIIVLAEAVILNDRVQPLRLAPVGANPIGQECVNTGWGNSNPTGGTPAIVPDVLQEVVLTIIENEDCKKRFSGVNGVFDHMICGHILEGGKGACNGDSGGPLVCYDKDGPYLAGIVSWGMQPCAQAKYASVYTRVSKFLPFFHDGVQMTAGQIDTQP